MSGYRHRRLRLVVGIILTLVVLGSYQAFESAPMATQLTTEEARELQAVYDKARKELAQLDVKGRAPKTNYSRDQFGNGWQRQAACDMRNIILNRDLKEVEIDSECRVIAGTLSDPYTGEDIVFRRGQTSSKVQIDHVVALSDAWQKGAQNLDYGRRVSFANDPLNLLAVSGKSNQEKSGSDAASWLPPNKAFRCQYVSRQVQVKYRYDLWVTAAEKQAIERILGECQLNRAAKHRRLLAPRTAKIG